MYRLFGRALPKCGGGRGPKVILEVVTYGSEYDPEQFASPGNSAWIRLGEWPVK